MLVFGASEWLHTDPTCQNNLRIVISGTSLAAATLFAFGFYGYWAALHLQHNILHLFTLILMICFVLELCFGAVIYSFSGKALRNDSLFLMQEASDDRIKFFQIQEKNKCCGSKSYKDWFETPWWKAERKKHSNLVVPESCCSVPGCEIGVPPFYDVTDLRNLYQQCCQDTIRDRRNLQQWVTAGLTILCGLLHLIAFFALHYRANIIIILQQELASARMDKS
ncbi:CD151 antigen-like [Parasteatoda tepidariorum]|uniref:CD151 antigen-like n=1 Tax=Parasteatoda tepidariorum TaxID=114398 RepID=UPI0039BD4973